MSGILKYKNASGQWVGLDAIRGEKGADGTMTFEDLTPEQKASLKGDKGDKGDTGEQGPQGIQGIQGIQGPAGPKGDNGSDATATDVQINGTSIVTDGVANIPVANNTFGVVKVAGYSGLRIHTDNSLRINEATDNQITLRYGLGAGAAYGVITPNKLDYVVKCALCDGKGQAYTDEEKASARARLGAEASDYKLILDQTSAEDTSKLIVDLGGAYTDLVVYVFVPARTVTAVVKIGVIDNLDSERLLTYHALTANVSYHYCFPYIKCLKDAPTARKIIGGYYYSGGSSFNSNGGFNQGAISGFYSSGTSSTQSMKAILVWDYTNADLILAGTRVTVLARSKVE